MTSAIEQADTVHNNVTSAATKLTYFDRLTSFTEEGTIANPSEARTTLEAIAAHIKTALTALDA